MAGRGAAGRDGWSEIGDRVWVRRYEFADETVGVVEGAAGAVVVDTRASGAHARELQQDLRWLGAGPVVAVVNTHGHWDHAFGNETFLPAPIWGHVHCPDFMARTAEPMRALLLGMDLTPQEADALRAVEVTPPSRLVESADRIDLGDRSVELVHLGLGHTDNDLVVRVPDAGALLAGDLVKQSGPPGFRDSFPIAWADTAGRLAELVEGPVAPGHGRVVDRAFVEAQAADLRLLAELLTAADDGSVAEAEVLARSPFPARATRQALARARVELGRATHAPLVPPA